MKDNDLEKYIIFKGVLQAIEDYTETNGCDKELFERIVKKVRYSVNMGNQRRLTYMSPDVYKNYLKAEKKISKTDKCEDHVTGARAAIIIYRKYRMFGNLTQTNLMKDIDTLNYTWYITSHENQLVKTKKGETWVQSYKRAGITEMVNYITGEYIKIKDLVKRENLKVI